MTETIPSNGNLPMGPLNSLPFDGDLGAKIDAAPLATDPGRRR